MFNVGDTLLKLATESGFAGFFANGGWQNLVMVVIACVLLYLGIVKGFEPLLLVGIAFGCLLANISLCSWRWQTNGGVLSRHPDGL